MKTKLLMLSFLVFGSVEMTTAQVISAFPFVEDFESEIQGPTGCGPSYTLSPGTWMNGDDAPLPSGNHQLDWTSDVGGTSSSSTGPSVDHTLGNSSGYYMYVETSCSGTGYPNIVSELVSPWMDFTALTMPQLDFWYHMYGTSQGFLHIDAQVGSLGPWQMDLIPALNDNQDLWQNQVVALTAFAGMDSVRLRFRNITGTSFTSDIALDDISVLQPPPFDLSGLGVLPSGLGCGLGTQTVSVQYRNDGSDPIASGETIVFNYQDGTNTLTESYTTTGILNPSDTLTYTFVGMPNFAVAGEYTMQVWTDYIPDVSNDNDSVWFTFNAKPLISTYPYLQNFESGTGGFGALNSTSGASNGTWEFGTPAKSVIIGAASGNDAWVSGGLTGSYLSNDNSWVDGPCFDFTSISAGAFISMKIWWEAEFSWDGANLQSSTDDGVTWTNIGALGDPNNWYNDGTINGSPGGSQEGWTGRNGSGSDGWVLAYHDIPASLFGQPSVRIRVAFGTDGSVTDDGFGFDDFAIGYPETITVASFDDIVSCDPVTLDYGSTIGFYNWSILDVSMNEVSRGAGFSGLYNFTNPGTTDSTFYFVLDYADPSGSNAVHDTVMITLSTGVGMVSNVGATNISEYAADITWDPILAGSFLIEYREIGTTPWSSMTVATANAVMGSIAGLTASTTYEVRVTASCSPTVSGIPSATTFFTTNAITCSSPIAMSVTSNLGNAITMGWTAIPATGWYAFEYKASASGTWISGGTLGGAATSKTFSGLTAATSYDFRAKTYCPNGAAGPWSAVVTATTGPLSGCALAPAMTASPVTGSGATINWTAVSGAGFYEFRYKPASSSTWISGGTAGPSATSKPYTGLTMNTTYDFEGRTYCANGIPSSWGAISFTTTALAGCELPPVLNPTAVATASSLQISWPAVSGAGWYSFQYKASSSSIWINGGTAGPSATAKTYSGLSAGTSYDFQIRTHCPNGVASAWSGTGTYSTSGGAPSFVTTTDKADGDMADKALAQSGHLTTVYPNPVADKVNIEIFMDAASDNTTVKLMDMSGRLVREVSTQTKTGVNTITLDVQDLSNGMYTVMVYENGSLLHTSKVKKN